MKQTQDIKIGNITDRLDFDADTSKVGILVAKWEDDPYDAVIRYQNPASENYGNLMDRSIKDVLDMITGGNGGDYLNTLITSGEVLLNGELDGKVVQYHSRYNKDTNHIQGVIVDLTQLHETEIVRMEQLYRLAEIGATASGIVHDLNNPLTAVLGYAQILRLDATSNRDYVDNIVHESERIMEMVKDITKTARGEDVLNKKDVRLSQYVDSFVNYAMNKVRMNNVSLSTSYAYDGIVRIDEKKMDRVLENLVNNAIKALKDQNKKEILIYTDEASGDAVINVEDSGPGVPCDCQLFEFGVTCSKGGGIGLYTVKKIVELHDGVVSYSRNPSTFSIGLPTYN